MPRKGHALRFRDELPSSAQSSVSVITISVAGSQKKTQFSFKLNDVLWASHTRLPPLTPLTSVLLCSHSHLVILSSPSSLPLPAFYFSPSHCCCEFFYKLFFASFSSAFFHARKFEALLIFASAGAVHLAGCICGRQTSEMPLHQCDVPSDSSAPDYFAAHMSF